MSMGTKDFHVQGPQINQFNNIAPRAIPRSAFKRDFTKRTTFNTNVLVPIFVDEILPGDEVNIRMTAFTRMSTPIKPLMDNLYQETFWFFVPNRLVWINWENFQGQQSFPGAPTDFTIPVLDHTKAPLSTTGFLNQSIFDYLEMPTRVTGVQNISALYNRAYNLIWNEWFRDENLQDSLLIPNDDGPDDPGGYALTTRNKRKDYITSCLPWPQKGDAVSINLGTTAPLQWTGVPLTIASSISRNSNASAWTVYNAGGNSGSGNGTLSSSGSSNLHGGASAVDVSLDPNGGLSASATLTSGLEGKYVADLSTASAITINALRQAALHQQILELDARGGTRYVESIYARFGVISPDFRLQRPELIGQGSTRINVYAVPQTAPTVSGQTPQGNLAAFGTSVIHGDHGCRYSATEHGMLIGLSNVRADLTYQQGLPRRYSRRTRLDFYEPLLNGLGEQAVLNQELVATGTSTDTEPFGYQERFSEYRFMNSSITGKFRSNDPQPLDVWHLSQHFTGLPGLNGAFITEDVPMDRVLAVNTEPSFLCDMSFSYHHVRPMPIRSNPGIDIL